MNWFTNFFGNKSIKVQMPTINSIQFDISDWRLQERSEYRVVWVNKDGGALSIDFVQSTPDFPALSDLDSLRSFCRELATGEGKVGGIISVDVVGMDGFPALKTIYKYELLPAYGYTGMLIIPFKRFYYVITIASGERGTTGVRDAVVTAQLAEEGKLEIEMFEKPDASGRAGRMKGWFQDPYDQEYKGHVLRSISDDEKYDHLFPDHPLSKVRKFLMQIKSSVKVDEKILQQYKL